ncbi:MAG: hypothetical protein KatS3mg115_2339 [Candidatus Poribacteria bacterium]|nr:MAG: hypothetical protein KatS3mg115_2339 [Candidatus Poribacteria bacterium]
MRYISEFRDPRVARALIAQLHELAQEGGEHTFMEVCGTHTMSVYRHGIKDVLPPNVELISGPGCPVCVTPQSYMDHAVALARRPETILTTFGDMMRVPGSTSSLEAEKAHGADIRVVYSPMESLQVAREHPGHAVVFLAVGFETTAPLVAATVLAAEREGLENFYVLVAHKTIPETMRALAESGELGLDGFLCPAHVSTIIGTEGVPVPGRGVPAALCDRRL